MLLVDDEEIILESGPPDHAPRPARSAGGAHQRLRPEGGYPGLLAQGLVGFVQKPYRIQDLARDLNRVLEGRSTR